MSTEYNARIRRNSEYEIELTAFIKLSQPDRFYIKEKGYQINMTKADVKELVKFFSMCIG